MNTKIINTLGILGIIYLVISIFDTTFWMIQNIMYLE